MTFIQHTGISKRIRISQFGFRGLLGTQVIEGDTMAPSGLYARLCHAFLVSIPVRTRFKVIYVKILKKTLNFKGDNTQSKRINWRHVDLLRLLSV